MKFLSFLLIIYWGNFSKPSVRLKMLLVSCSVCLFVKKYYPIYFKFEIHTCVLPGTDCLVFGIHSSSIHSCYAYHWRIMLGHHQSFGMSRQIFVKITWFTWNSGEYTNTLHEINYVNFCVSINDLYMSCIGYHKIIGIQYSSYTESVYKLLVVFLTFNLGNMLFWSKS